MSKAVEAVSRKYPMGAPRGGKQIFLPNFVLTLLRTPKLPPTFATFIVPLNFNKLDLRDYLYHGYNIKVNAVRSYIQQQKLREDKPGTLIPKRGQWMRPRSIKKMTVEMEQPFRWPAEPEDYDAWEQERHKAATKDQEQSQEPYRDPKAWRTKPTRERTSMAEQAREAQGILTQAKHVRRLLDRQKRLGRLEKQIKSDSEGWEDVGEAIEVEVDVDTAEIPKLDKRSAVPSKEEGSKEEDLKEEESAVIKDSEPIAGKVLGRESSSPPDSGVATPKHAPGKGKALENLSKLIRKEQNKLTRLIRKEKEPVEKLPKEKRRKEKKSEAKEPEEKSSQGEVLGEDKLQSE